MKYQVLTTEKTGDVTVDEAQAALAEEYPAYKVEVHESGNQFIAKLTKTAADDEDDEEEDGPPAKKNVPPFLEERDNEDAGDEGEKKPSKKPESDDDDGDDSEDKAEDKDDLGFQDPDAGTSDVVKALKALKTLDHVLPKLKDQLKSLNGGDDLGGEGGPEGLVPPGPPGGPEKGVGPVPGAPPSAALPEGPAGGKAPFAPPPAPNVNHGLDLRKGPKGPGVGPSTFGSVKDKFIYRPVGNEDGTRTSLVEATAEIEQLPKYASYIVEEVKYDEDGDQWVAHLKLAG